MSGTLIGISYLVFWFTRFFHKRTSLILGHIACLAIRYIAFLINGNINGLIDSSLVIVREALGIMTYTKQHVIKIIALVILTVGGIILQGLAFAGIITIVIVIKNLVATFGVIFLNAQGIRITGLASSVLYTIFLFLSGEYVGTMLEIITSSFLLISYIKEKDNERKEQKSEVVNN